MTVNQMECFVEAGKWLNFTKAAESLYMSQQTMSRQIKALEKELGFALFERKNNGVILTEPGSILYHSWENILQIHRESVDKAKDLYYGGVSQVRIGVSDFGNYLSTVTQAILYFNEEYPELNIEYEVDSFPNMLSRLESGKLNLIITYSAEAAREPDLNVIAVPNTQYEVGIVISRTHPLSRRKNLGIQDIKDEIIAVLGQEISNDHEERIVNWFRNNNMPETPQMRSFNSFRNLQIALAAGKCVAVMFRRAMDGMENRLKFYPISDPEAEINADIVIAWKEKKFETKSKYLARLLEQLRSRI